MRVEAANGKITITLSNKAEQEAMMRQLSAKIHEDPISPSYGCGEVLLETYSAVHVGGSTACVVGFEPHSAWGSE